MLKPVALEFGRLPNYRIFWLHTFSLLDCSPSRYLLKLKMA